MWSRTDKIAFASFVVTLIACIAAVIVIPEVRLLLGLDKKESIKKQEVNKSKEKAERVNYGRRLALVIGNSKYESKPLRYPMNDAKNIANLLTQKEFQVKLIIDADGRTLEKTIVEFGKKLGGGGVGLVYFSGYAISLNDGQDEQYFIMPIDTKMDEDVKIKGISLNSLSGIIHDNRKEPYSGGIFVATTENSEYISNVSNTNGIYTKHLLEQMNKPGIEIHRMLRETRIAVERETDLKQTIKEISTSVKDFYFNPIEDNFFDGSFFIFIIDSYNYKGLSK